MGISNPNFIGVTVATKAICTDYAPVNHVNHSTLVPMIAQTILKEDPDVLVVGGWSKGYGDILAYLKERKRRFPVIGVYHGGLFHHNVFNDQLYFQQFLAAQKRGSIDVTGFVNPPTAEYFQKVRGERNVAFVPHYFKPLKLRVDLRYPFRIGVFGGTANWVKNAGGAAVVAQDYVNNTPNCALTTTNSYGQSRELFLGSVNECSLLIHISHLECYSNLVQEGWARGIPVIYSAASDGLVSQNPLLAKDEKYQLNHLRMESNIDAVELYDLITHVHRNWDKYSESVHDIYRKLAVRTENYLKELFDQVCRSHKKGGVRSSNFFLRALDDASHL